MNWDEYLQRRRASIVESQEDMKTPSKGSRLIDPPGSAKKGGLVGPDLDSRPLLTVDALSLVGGLEDENGRYRLYQRLDDQRPPF